MDICSSWKEPSRTITFSPQWEQGCGQKHCITPSSLLLKALVLSLGYTLNSKKHPVGLLRVHGYHWKTRDAGPASVTGPGPSWPGRATGRYLTRDFSVVNPLPHSDCPTR